MRSRLTRQNILHFPNWVSHNNFLITHTFFNYLIDQRNGDTSHEMAEVVNFHIAQLTMSEIAPLLKGFCGDFVHGIEQMAETTSHFSLRTAKTGEF